LESIPRAKNPLRHARFGPSETFQQIIDAWHRRSKEDSEKNPDSDQQFNEPDQTSIVYSIMIITPADQYEKNEKLFKEIVEGFRYGATRQRSISTPE
jgi:hypothetical protein